MTAEPGRLRRKEPTTLSDGRPSCRYLGRLRPWPSTAWPRCTRGSGVGPWGASGSEGASCGHCRSTHPPPRQVALNRIDDALLAGRGDGDYASALAFETDSFPVRRRIAPAAPTPRTPLGQNWPARVVDHGVHGLILHDHSITQPLGLCNSGLVLVGLVLVGLV